MLRKRIYEISILSVTIFTSVYSKVFAANPLEYTPLEPGAFPGLSTASNPNFLNFLGQVFNYGISIAVVLALVMIIWGGIQKMTTDSWFGQDEAKKKIKDALIGLGLALVSWILLYTINPCLVDFTGKAGCSTKNLLFNAGSTISSNSTISSTNAGMTQTTTNTNSSASSKQLLTDSEARSQLQAAGVSIYSSGICTDQNNKTCTSFEQIPQSAISKIISANNSCGGCITVTAGTETGHKSHRSGVANVDIQYSEEARSALKSIGLNEYSSYTDNRNSFACEPPGGGQVSIPCGSGAGVIHTQF